MRPGKLGAFLCAVLVGVLGFLYVESQVRGGDPYNRTMDAARHLRELDARLDRAVLESETGLLLDYDALSATVREMEVTQASIEQTSRDANHELDAPVAETAARVAEKARLVEQFKSANSIVRNSVVFIPLGARQFMALPAHDAASDAARGEVTALLASVLRCNVDCPTPALALLLADISALSATRDLVPSPGREKISVLLRHATLVASAAPQLGHAVHSLIDVGGRPYDDLYVAARGRREAAIERANGYRVALVLLSVVLLVAIGVMVFRLRGNAAQLERTLASLENEKRIVVEKSTELEALNESLESRVEERTRELTRSKEQYRSLLESTEAVPWEMAPDTTRFAYVGPQAVSLLGYSAAAWQEERFFERLLHPEDLAESASIAATLMPGAPHKELEVRVLACDGRSVWLRVFASASEDEDGGIVRRGFFLDVTARHQLEAELRSAQKLESVGRLAAGVAHEINTPVQFVSDGVRFVAESFTELARVLRALRLLLTASPAELPDRMAKARAEDDAADTDYLVENIPQALESSVDGLGRIAGIVKALKAFSHPDRTQKSAVDLAANIRTTLTIAANEYKHVADLVTDIPELPLVACHGGEINQVLLNLIVNASHAICDKVKGTVRRGTIDVRAWHDLDNVFVCVRDTGDGIPAAVQSKIFEPFFTTKDVGKGSGQGLAISRGIVVDKHGGDLSFETVAGVGTAFLLRLPIVASRAKTRSSSQPSISAAA